MSDHTATITEAERQLLLLALAKLSITRPGFDYVLNELALKFDNVCERRGQMYDDLRKVQALPGDETASDERAATLEYLDGWAREAEAGTVRGHAMTIRMMRETIERGEHWRKKDPSRR